jgi:UMF1 family MFS transporter
MRVEPAVPAAAWRSVRVLRWSLFDVASSGYVALVPGFFGLYFIGVLAAGSSSGPAWWGLTAGVALIVAGVLAPIVGAWADRSARWFVALTAASLVCVVATALLSQSAALILPAALLLFVLAQAGYTLAIAQYDALLVRLSVPGQGARMSSLGWAIGLVGGMLALGAALWLLQAAPPAQQLAQLTAVFLMVGLLFGLLAAPALWALHDVVPAARATVPPASAGEALRCVWLTCRQWRRHRTAFLLLGGFFLVNDVLVTLQFFSGIVLRDRFALSVADMLWLSLLFHAVALPSTLLAGVWADRIGAPQALASMCALLAAALLLLALGTAPWTPAAAAVLLGMVIAPVQAVFRALYAAHVPPQQMAELFGFSALTGRVAAALGPAVFGVASAVLGIGPALLLLLLPLAAGAVLLLRAGAARD